MYSTFENFRPQDSHIPDVVTIPKSQLIAVMRSVKMYIHLAADQVNQPVRAGYVSAQLLLRCRETPTFTCLPLKESSKQTNHHTYMVTCQPDH